MLKHNALRQSLKFTACVNTTSAKQSLVINAFRLSHYSLWSFRKKAYLSI